MMEFVYPRLVEIAFFATIILLLLVAAISDVVRFVIPNSISVSLAALFFVAWFVLPVHTSLLAHLGAGLLVLVVGMVLFRYGLFGGGDVKLWSAAALWFGFGTFYSQLEYVSLAGGALGVLLYLARRWAARYRDVESGGQGATMPPLLQDGAAVPYGVAIAIGTILTLNKTPFFARLFV